MGAAVAQLVAEHNPVPVKFLGIPDENAVIGNSKEIFHHYKMDYEGIIETVKAWLQ
ncbi:MAG: hypothetical protein J6R71_01280 [Bacteroidales bacterium]|nr:hypothetical protein [Bacteroidales bacterium]